MCPDRRNYGIPITGLHQAISSFTVLGGSGLHKPISSFTILSVSGLHKAISSFTVLSVPGLDKTISSFTVLSFRFGQSNKQFYSVRHEQFLPSVVC